MSSKSVALGRTAVSLRTRRGPGPRGRVVGTGSARNGAEGLLGGGRVERCRDEPTLDTYQRLARERGGRERHKRDEEAGADRQCYRSYPPAAVRRQRKREGVSPTRPGKDFHLVPGS